MSKWIDVPTGPGFWVRKWGGHLTGHELVLVDGEVRYEWGGVNIPPHEGMSWRQWVDESGLDVYEATLGQAGSEV